MSSTENLAMAADLLRRHADRIAWDGAADPGLTVEILREAARTITESVAPATGDALVCEWLYQLSEQHTITHRETADLRGALELLAEGVAYSGGTVQLPGPDLATVAGKLASELDRRAAMFESLPTAKEFYAGTIRTLRQAERTARSIASTSTASASEADR